MSTQALEDLKERFIEQTIQSWNEGDLDAVDEFFAADVVVHNIGRGERYDDREAYKAWIAEVREEFPDFEAETLATVVGDDTLVHQWVARGTNEGEFVPVGLGPTNEFAEWEGIAVYRFEDEMVAESWWYYDMFGMLNQLGLLPE